MRPRHRIEVGRERFGESNPPCCTRRGSRQSSSTSRRKHDKRRDHFRVAAASSSARCRLVRIYLSFTLPALERDLYSSHLAFRKSGLVERRRRRRPEERGGKRKSAGKCRKRTSRRDESSAAIDRTGATKMPCISTRTWAAIGDSRLRRQCAVE